MKKTAKRIEALLIWKHPVSRLRYVIGRLGRDAEGFYYTHERDLPHSLGEALEQGFPPLDPFPLEQKKFQQKNLFPLFARRLPPAWRNDEYERLGLRQDQSLEYLLASGGRMVSDTFEFLESLDSGTVGEMIELDFPISGWQYHDGESIKDQLGVGDELKLVLETENKHDPSAIQICSIGDVLLGYVPRTYSWYIDDCVATGQFSAKIKPLGSPDEPKVCIIVSFKAELDQGKFRRIPTGFKTLACV